jgi:hypothetical protein
MGTRDGKGTRGTHRKDKIREIRQKRTVEEI